MAKKLHTLKKKMAENTESMTKMSFKDKLKDMNDNFKVGMFRLKHNQILRTTGLVMTLAGIMAGVVLVNRVQLFQKKAVGTNVQLSLPTTFTANPGEIFTIPVTLYTDNHSVSAVDVLISFDRTYLEVTSVRSRSDTSTLKGYLPQINGVYDNQTAVNNANATGIITFGALTYLSGVVQPGFNGTLGPSNPLAQISFKAVRPISGTPVNFVFQGASATKDSNVIGSSESADILGRTQNMVVTIPGTPTPTTLITSSPTMTVAPTTTPIPGSGDTVNPTVSFANPTNDSSFNVNTEVRFQVNASDNVEVDKVQFYINGVFVHVEENSPYTLTWTVPSTSNTKYAVMARALDNAGNAASTTVTIKSKN